MLIAHLFNDEGIDLVLRERSRCRWLPWRRIILLPIRAASPFNLTLLEKQLFLLKRQIRELPKGHAICQVGSIDTPIPQHSHGPFSPLGTRLQLREKMEVDLRVGDLDFLVNMVETLANRIYKGNEVGDIMRLGGINVKELVNLMQ